MSTLTDPRTFGPHRRTSTMDSSRRSIFGSFRSSLSRSKQSSSSNTQQPAKYVAQPTRRPAAPSSNPFHSASSFDAPPAYSEVTNAAPQLAPISRQTATVDDDEYAFLDTFDTVFLIDDSGSMAGGLWRQTAEALMTIAPICTAHDEDGIDIYFINNPAVYKNVRSSTRVQEIFETVRPGGSTNTGQRLNKILVKNYLEEYEKKPDTTKPMNLICITDGAPTDDDEGPLIDTAEMLDDLRAPAWQVGIQFFQVGSDPKAARHLKVLDDDLAKFSTRDRMRDIVDTVPFTDANGGRLSADGILKVVLGAVTRRLDRNSEDLHR